jgi:hypothetical protein
MEVAQPTLRHAEWKKDADVADFARMRQSQWHSRMEEEHALLQ